MMNLSRRGLLGGLIGAVACAPAIIRTPGLLMPIKPGLVVNDWGGMQLGDYFTLPGPQFGEMQVFLVTSITDGEFRYVRCGNA